MGTRSRSPNETPDGSRKWVGCVGVFRGLEPWTVHGWTREWGSSLRTRRGASRTLQTCNRPSQQQILPSFEFKTLQFCVSSCISFDDAKFQLMSSTASNCRGGRGELDRSCQVREAPATWPRRSITSRVGRCRFPIRK